VTFFAWTIAFLAFLVLSQQQKRILKELKALREMLEAAE
jgi:hypothetical protein